VLRRSPIWILYGIVIAIVGIVMVATGKTAGFVLIAAGVLGTIVRLTR
jgi:hypothetical protein